MTTPANHFYWDKLVNRQVAVWEAREQQRQLHPERMESPGEYAYITISRAYGALGYKIADAIGSVLNWIVYSRELVEYICDTANIRQRVAETFDERKLNKVESWIANIVDPSSLAFDDYYRHLVRVIVTVAEHGHCVIVGRGANYILPPEHGLRVRITAPMDFRVRMIATRQNLSDKEARKLIQKKDHERAAFVKQHFRVDVRDTDGYDLVLNVANFSIEQAFHIIIQSLQTKLNIETPGLATEPTLPRLSSLDDAQDPPDEEPSPETETKTETETESEIENVL
jgi:cytidylate kinase